MTEAVDDMDFRDLVDLLTEEDQQALRPVVLRLIASYGKSATHQQMLTEPKRRLSFAGTVEAEANFASASQEVQWRDLGGRE